MHILNKQAIIALNQKLHLPANGQEQDWDIELANPGRIDEFFSVFKENKQIDSEQRYALMALTLASCEYALQEGKALNESWEDIKRILTTDPLYKNLLDYWSLPTNGEVDDTFAITAYLY